MDMNRFSPWKRVSSSRSSTGLSNISAARTKSTPNFSMFSWRRASSHSNMNASCPQNTGPHATRAGYTWQA
jgi:hypothetical protein